jgi:hypothetical protein
MGATCFSKSISAAQIDETGKTESEQKETKVTKGSKYWNDGLRRTRSGAELLSMDFIF